MKQVLELFSGTQSVGKVLKEKGYNVISVDINDYEGVTPTHKIDILDFDYKQYKKFDIIWCSPPCVNYSQLQYACLGREKIIDGNRVVWTKELWNEKMNESDLLVAKCFEIINYFKPKYWFMENPQTGLLKTRIIMKDKEFYDTDYCKYSNWGYRKRTRIWTNKKLNLLKCNKDCQNIIKNGKKYKHKGSIQDIGGGYERHKRYKIPPKLIKAIMV